MAHVDDRYNLPSRSNGNCHKLSQIDHFVESYKIAVAVCWSETRKMSRCEMSSSCTVANERAEILEHKNWRSKLTGERGRRKREESVGHSHWTVSKDVVNLWGRGVLRCDGIDTMKTLILFCPCYFRKPSSAWLHEVMPIAELPYSSFATCVSEVSITFLSVIE